LNFENKKQIFIIIAAIAVGIVAVVLMSNYIKTSVQSQTAQLAESFKDQQKEVVSQLQQRSEQQMAALAQELERVKGQQASDMQQQMAALQVAQQNQTRVQQVAAPVVRSNRKPSLALKTPVGKRAVTVMIDSLSAVGGLINAGDYVDVIAQLNVPSGDANKTVTAMIFQDLQVLAINTNMDDPGAYDEQQASGSLKITFAVDPQEASLLNFANKNGILELALRSPDEKNKKKVKASTWRTLADYVLKNQGLNIEDPDGDNANRPIEESKPNIQIFRGGKEL